MSGPPRREDGVSNVLGAVLMFGLLMLTLTVIQVRFVPVWGEDREARHMQRLSDDLAQLKSDLDRQAGNDTATPVTANLQLGDAGGFRLFKPSNPVGSTAGFTPSPSGAGLAASSAKPVQVLRRDGQDLFGGGSSWDPLLEGDTEVTNVLSIQHLRQRIDLMDVGGDSFIGGPNTNDYQDDDLVTLTIFSSTDDVNPLVTVVTNNQHDTNSYTFTIHVFDSSGDEVSTDFESMFHQVNQEYLYFDLLDSSLFLEPLLAQGQAPFRIALDEDGLHADYQVVYTDADSGGLAGAAGVLDTSGFSVLQDSGRVELQALNQHYEDQTYVLEHGAVLVEQARGSAMVAPPAIGASIGSDLATFSWTMAGLDGDGVARAGERVVAVASPGGSAEDLWILAPQATLTIPTTRGEAWETYLDDLLTDAGWTTGTYTITTNAANVQLLLEGPFANDASCTAADQTNCDYDVSLRLRIGDVDLALVAG